MIVGFGQLDPESQPKNQKEFVVRYDSHNPVTIAEFLAAKGATLEAKMCAVCVC